MRIETNTASAKLQDSVGITFPSAMGLYVEQHAFEQSAYIEDAKKDVRIAMEIYNEAQAICDAAMVRAMQKLRDADLEAFAEACESGDYYALAI